MKNKNINSKNQDYKVMGFLSQRTYSEDILWHHALETGKMNGYEFLKQFPICQYTVSFICRKLNLIIEIEGNSRDLKTESDQRKEDDLLMLGYRILYFTEFEVLNEIDRVIKKISHTIQSLEQKTNKLLN